MKEKFNGEKVIVKLTKAEITRMCNGQIIEGFKASVMMEDQDVQT